MKNYLIFGATDRANYGDLLFPLVCSRLLAENEASGEIVNVGLVASDLSDMGAMPTLSFRRAAKGMNPSQSYVLIVAGGEVLSTDWLAALGYVFKPVSLLAYFVPDGMKWRLNRVLQYVMRGRHPLAFHSHFDTNVDTAYVSVGGFRTKSPNSFTDKERALRNNLSQAAYVSVRDADVAESVLLLTNRRPELTPDSAIIVSDLFGEDTPQRSPRPYIAVQCGLQKIEGRIDQLAKALFTAHERTGLDIVLFAIGTAPGHEDDRATALLQEKVQALGVDRSSLC